STINQRRSPRCSCRKLSTLYPSQPPSWAIQSPSATADPSLLPREQQVCPVGRVPSSPQLGEEPFFARFLERAWHSSADPERGRFRSFLLTALKRFLIDSDAEGAALKRGGGIRFELLDDDDCAGATGETPDAAFEREWAHAVLRAALARLRSEAEQAGKLELFKRLAEFLIERPDEAEYARAAEDLHLRRNTLAVAVHR